MKRASPKHVESIRKMTEMIRQACLVAKDSAFNVGEYTRDSSKMAFLAVKDCEKELDRIERKVDESITGAITEVTETEARELLACLKFIIDLERIGDLLWSAAKRLQVLGAQLSKDDIRDVAEMAGILESMLETYSSGLYKSRRAGRGVGAANRRPHRRSLSRDLPPPSGKDGPPRAGIQHKSAVYCAGL